MKPFPWWNKSFFDNPRATVIHIQFKSEQTLSHPLRRALCFASTFNAFPFGSIFCSQENKVLALLHPLQSMERSSCLSNLGSLEEIPALDTMFQAQFSIALETDKMGWPEPTAIRDNLGSLEVDWKSEKVSRPNSSKRTIGREDPRRMEEGLRRGGKRGRSHGDSQQTPCCFSF